MKNYIQTVVVALLALFICSCRCSGNGAELKGDAEGHQMSVSPDDGEAAFLAGEPDEPTWEEMEEFYLSLPVLGLPLTWDDEEFENRYPVPERIANYLGFDYIYDNFDASRLPEMDGARSIIVTTGETGGFITMYIFVFPAGEMRGGDFIAIYNVREIDEGPDMMVNFFEIDERMEIELTTHYIGTGAEGDKINILFRRQYLKPASDGSLHRVEDRSRETITYTEEEDSVFGESFHSYNFKITIHKPLFDENTGEWDYEDEVKRYSLDSGYLTEVDLFDNERDHE